jgi:hypothetical protein
LRTFRAPAVTDPELRDSLKAVEEAANRADPFLELQILHAAPVRIRAGMLVIADGTDWNPGSGAGLYRRNAANAAWVFIG